ncbi:speckle-type POZ protein-like [Belonocnema kinseyi]|uniref:speckle-type POZ protein-like n=1 Tax=Belonocnema kinseyi TaxID=2817044 RepID=UPI00143CFA69|nr:speckle-type POZ protein-like [Belonocnema kinseyi]
MAVAIDLLEMTRMVSANNSRYPSGKDPNVYKLISVHFDSIKASKTSSVDIILQEDPQIACTLNLLHSDECVRMSMNFKSKDLSPKLKYEASLYYLNWDLKMTLLESMKLENIRNDSIYHFAVPLKCFMNDKDNIPRKILINDHCFLYCEITRKDQVLIPNMIIEVPDGGMATDFFMLFPLGLYSDVEITCGDEMFDTHKLILSVRSLVFRDMLESQMEESKKIRITITDVDSDIIGHMLWFIYSDTVSNLETGQAEKLLVAADKYMLENLKLICMQEMFRSVTDIEKASEVLAIAEKYNVIAFRNMALDFIENNDKSS